jgi:hypothetical protein
MYQNLVEGREVPWGLLVKDMPRRKQRDLDFIVEQLDWDANVDPYFKKHHYLEPAVHTADDAHVDKWIVYGRVDGKQLFSAKELTVLPGGSATIRDGGASGVIVVQGRGSANGLTINSPKLIRFGELTEDEFFITAGAAKAGVTYVNTSAAEPLVMLRYFGPEANPDAPEVGG